jgi:hypothetical protein
MNVMDYAFHYLITLQYKELWIAEEELQFYT